MAYPGVDDTEEVQQSDILSMSDDELLALPPEELESLLSAAENAVNDGTAPEVSPEEALAEVLPADDEPVEEDGVDNDGQPDTEESADNDSVESVDDSSADEVVSTDDVDESEEVVTDESEEEVEAKEESNESDEAKQLAELFAPFKAIGKEVQIDNVADARQLMQMGIGYNKKMAALKPNLKMLKMLEKNDMLDMDKLSFLIDVQNKNPDAIAKLLSDSGIDPLDIKTKDLGEYKPPSYNVSDNELALDSVVDDIRESSAYETTSDIVTNKWDQTSQEFLVQNPNVIKDINTHVENGIYDQISKVMETERMLGRLNGLSDLQAYQQIGNALYEAGTLVGVEYPTEPKATIKAPAKPVEKKSDAKLTAKRKAASPPKGKVAASEPKFDPLAMSDDEFEDAMAKGLFKLK